MSRGVRAGTVIYSQGVFDISRNCSESFFHEGASWPLPGGARADPHSACAEKVAARQVAPEVTENVVEDSWEEHSIRRHKMLV